MTFFNQIGAVIFQFFSKGFHAWWEIVGAFDVADELL